MSTLFSTPDLCIKETPVRDMDRTWVVTINRNNMSFPNFDGPDPELVIKEAAAYLGEEPHKLSITRQIDWYD